MPEKIENKYGLSAPREFFPGEGQQDAVAWGRGDHLTASQVLPAVLNKSLALVSVVMNDTFTTLNVAPGPQAVINSSAYTRPDFESHLFFYSHWIFQLTTTGAVPSPLTALTIEIQGWLNQYHLLISPSGFANDFVTTIAHPGIASQTVVFHQTFLGAMFNVELRRQPDVHIIDFRYIFTSLPTGWSQAQIKPRMIQVFAIPSSAVTFTKV